MCQSFFPQPTTFSNTSNISHLLVGAHQSAKVVGKFNQRKDAVRLHGVQGDPQGKLLGVVQLGEHFHCEPLPPIRMENWEKEEEEEEEKEFESVVIAADWDLRLFEACQLTAGC